MVLRGIYERHEVQSLNHGIGIDTAAIDLLPPTYGESLGLRGKICENWAMNPHPTLIPAMTQCTDPLPAVVHLPLDHRPHVCYQAPHSLVR